MLTSFPLVYHYLVLLVPVGLRGGEDFDLIVASHCIFILYYPLCNTIQPTAWVFLSANVLEVYQRGMDIL